MKVCIHCGTPLAGTKDAARKKYCDKECYRLHRLSQPLTNKSTGHFRARAAEKSKACNRCGALKNLEVHHRDLNVLNDSASNLEKICSTCHDMEHRAITPASICAVCGVSFTAASHRNRNKICSAQCAKEWGLKNALKRWVDPESADSEGTETLSMLKRRKSSSAQ